MRARCLTAAALVAALSVPAQAGKIHPVALACGDIAAVRSVVQTADSRGPLAAEKVESRLLGRETQPAECAIIRLAKPGKRVKVTLVETYTNVETSPNTLCDIVILRVTRGRFNGKDQTFYLAVKRLVGQGRSI